MSMSKIRKTKRSGRSVFTASSAVIALAAFLTFSGGQLGSGQAMAAEALKASAAQTNASAPAAPLDLAAKLPSDPTNVTGQFENGLKYIIRPHTNPPGRVVVYLHIKTGSFNETDAQRGLAHFLEHMAFNGSKNFPPGELIPFLNKLGMDFGQHTNAHTSYHETVYKLTMPDNKPETLEKALKIFSDYANGLLLDPKEIDDERGVILEEKRARTGPDDRLRDQMMETVFAGSHITNRKVIGTEEILTTVPPTEFADYWNTWYRPELMTLLVVGEVEPAAVVEMAKPYLGTFTARAPARQPMNSGLSPMNETRAFVFTDSELTRGEVSLMAVGAGRPPMTTVGEYRRETLEQVAQWIVSRRFREIRNEGKATYQGASVSVSELFNDATLASISADGEAGKWKEMTEQVILETKRAIDHGFTQRELDLARAEILSVAKRAVETEPTRDAVAVINVMASDVGVSRPMLSAKQDLELTEAILPTIQLSELHEAFRGKFANRPWQIMFESPVAKDGYTPPSNEELLSAVNKAWQAKTEAPVVAAAETTLLKEIPAPGKIASTSEIAQFNISTAEFENGVVMHHRFMDYKKDNVLITLTLPGGRLQETDATRGLSDAASLMLSRAATSRLTSNNIRDLMTGKNVNVSGGIGVDAMQISIGGSPKDIETGLQLVHAVLTDGVLEQAALDEWKSRSILQLQQAAKLPQGQLRNAIDRTIRGGDPRLSQLTEAIINSVQKSAAEEWMKRIAGSSAIEVAVVGEMSKETAQELVAKYVGSLPKRKGTFDDVDSLRKLDRKPGPYVENIKISSVTPQAIVLGAYIGADSSNIRDRRILNVAATALSERMNKRIREQERLVYSIGASSQSGREVPGTGLFLAAAPTDPAKADRLADVIFEMMKEFAAGGPTQEEVDTARKQLLNTLETNAKEPAFWLSLLSDFRYRDRTEAELLDMMSWLDSVTPEEVKEVTAKYVKDEGQVRIVVVPENPNKPAAPAN